MEELLPVLTAWLEDGPELVTTLRAALAGEVAFLPLEQPPFEQTTHILEVHVVGAGTPFVLVVEPVGFAKNGLFPLQLRPFDDEQRARFTETVALGEGPDHAAQRMSSLPPPPSAQQVARMVSRPPPDPLVGRGIGGGKFKIQQLLGSGAAGKVYRAFHRDLQKTVAIKVLHPFYQTDPGYAARFKGEALAASQIDHPNVLRILDFGQEPDGMLYIVMEFLEGSDLHAVIESDGPLPFERLVMIAMQICAGLSVAHDAGIVHRDIKPENVILVAGRDDEGRPTEIAKVCDFGIAQTRASEGGEERAICGTPEYMSPEQWQALDLDARTDVYALGVTLYEMATRFVPFTGRSTAEVFAAACSDAPPPPSLYNADIDPRLEAIIMRCLAKDRTHRYPSARELRADLRALVEPEGGAARLQRRRELLDASKLTPLDDESSGFAEFFVAFSTAVMRTGYYDKSHPESATALARLAASVDGILKHRGELSFARRDVGEAVVFTIVTGAGEVHELKKLLRPSVYELYAEKFGDVFARRSVVSLALRDGVDEMELSDLVDLLSGPEIPADELRAKFLARGFLSVSVLFVADLLGRKRKLPWQVDLCVSRLARDLSALPLVRGMDAEQQRVLRTQMVGDVIRALGKPDQIRSLLDNADLIAAEVSVQSELEQIDPTAVIVEALSIRSATALARFLLEELDGNVRPRPTASGSGSMPAVRVDPRAILQLVVGRFARERAAESDDVLRQLYDKSFLTLPDLPPDLQMWIRGEELATSVAEDPEPKLQALDAVVDADAYEREVAVFEFAARVLGRRSHVAGILAILDRFKAHASDPRKPPRIQQRAAAATAVLEEPEVLMCVAHTLLGGTMATREPSQRLLASVGAKAAAPLAEARLQLPSNDASLRARFAVTFRELGAPAMPVLAEKLAAFGPESDAALVEDFLRATPDVPDEALGKIVERFVAHPSPMVRRAAATALAALAGYDGRAALLELFSSNDDGVRLGALAGLRRVKAIDGEAIARIDKIVGGLAGAGEELRAASAAALVDAQPAMRSTALGVLARVVKVQRKSFVGLLKDALAAPQESAMVLVASARALVVLGGDKGREVVRERAAASSGVLKQQLESLLTAPQTGAGPM